MIAYFWIKLFPDSNWEPAMRIQSFSRPEFYVAGQTEEVTPAEIGPPVELPDELKALSLP